MSWNWLTPNELGEPATPAVGDLIEALRNDVDEAAADVLTVESDIGQRGRNVRQPIGIFAGAAGDGSTNDSAVIQAHIDAAAAADERLVVFPSGTFRCNLTHKPRVTLVGAGIGKTLLKAVAGSNADVIKGLNFATLTGKAYAAGDYALGAYRSGIVGMTIDGDKATQSAGYGIRVWGRGLRMHDVEIQNSKSGGYWSEFTTVDDFANFENQLDGYISGVFRVHNNDGNGWTHRGPHDTAVDSFECYSNTGWGLRVEQTPGGYNGGVTFKYYNIYLNGNGVYAGGSNMDVQAGVVAGEGGIALEIAAGTGGYQIRNRIGSDGSNTAGVIVRGTSHLLDVLIADIEGDAIRLDGCANCRIKAHGYNNFNVVNVVSEVAPNRIEGNFDIPATRTLKTGAAWHSRTRRDLHGDGAGGALSEQSFPSSTLLSGNGWSPVLPTSQGILAASGEIPLTYGASIPIDHALARFHRVTVTDAAAHAFAQPSNRRAEALTILVWNSTAGAIATATWHSIFKMDAWVPPAAGKVKIIEFRYFAGFDAYFEIGRSPDRTP